MKSILSVILTLIVFSSCMKKNEIDIQPIVDPPFEKYQHFWTEIEKKEGTGNWKRLAKGNVLRFFTNDSTALMQGKYEYNAVNAQINIPASYFFKLDKDSLRFYKPANSPSNPAEILASVEYELINDKLMVIRNKSGNTNIEIKYAKQ